ncbi:MAG: hypothetical protein IJG94_03035 [Clostridia bacterium]|nr:hypothetical protein [Clostridia bacterium]
MRKLCALLLALVLSLSLVCAQAEQSNFLISDWLLQYMLGDVVFAEQNVFIYEDGTFEIIDEADKLKGTWTFDGKTLVLTADAAVLTLQWNEETREFTGEYSEATIKMTLPIEPERGAAGNGNLAGGWAVAEDQAITEDLNNWFFQAMDSYQTGTITVAYTPVSLLSTQVVAGTNYAVLSKASEINQGTKWVIVYVYVDLKGNASILNIADLALGI